VDDDVGIVADSKDSTSLESVDGGVDEVVILSYPRYCRYRAAVRRLLDRSPAVVEALSPRLLAAVGLPPDLPPPFYADARRRPRVLFCRSTVVHPLLQKHIFRLDELGTSVIMRVEFVSRIGGVFLPFLRFLPHSLKP